MKSLFSACCLLLLLCSLDACKKVAGPAGPQGPAGPLLSGTITGFVHIYDQYGSRLFTGQDSVKVTLKGTGTFTYTDGNGNYSFNGLNTGVYSFVYEKSGFGSSQIQSVSFAGGDTLGVRDMELAKTPSFTIAGITTTVTAGTGITIAGTMTAADNLPRSVIVYVGLSNSVSSAAGGFLTYFTKNIPANGTNFNILIPENDLLNMGATVGSTVYFAAYPINSNFANASVYVDEATGTNVFTALGQPVTGSAVVQ